MAQKRSNFDDDRIVVLTRRICQSLDAPAGELQLLEFAEVRPPEDWLKIEEREFDPVHAILLARASIAQHLAVLFAGNRKLSEETSAGVFAIINFQFNLICAPILAGTPDKPAPNRSYSEVAMIIKNFVEQYCAKLPLQKGRPRIAPPDLRMYTEVHALTMKIRELKDEIVRPYIRLLGDDGWSSGRAIMRILNTEEYNENIDDLARGSLNDVGITLGDLRNTTVQTFVVELLDSEPTEAALRLAWIRAKADFGYDGGLRAFADAWRQSDTSLSSE